MIVWYPPCIPNSHPHRITSTKCRKNTVVSPDDGHSHLKHVEKKNRHTKKNCAPSWLYWQDYTGTNGQQNVKKKICVYRLTWCNITEDLRLLWECQMMHYWFIVFFLSDDVFTHFLPEWWNCSGNRVKIYVAVNSACGVSSGTTSCWRHMINYVHITALIIIQGYS